MRSPIMLIVAVGLVTAACATRPEWVPRPGGPVPVDPALYRQDDDQCRKENPAAQPPAKPGLFERLFGSKPAVDTSRYEACMRARGWVRPAERR